MSNGYLNPSNNVYAPRKRRLTVILLRDLGNRNNIKRLPLILGQCIWSFSLPPTSGTNLAVT